MLLLYILYGFIPVINDDDEGKARMHYPRSLSGSKGPYCQSQLERRLKGWLGVYLVLMGPWYAHPRFFPIDSSPASCVCSVLAEFSIGCTA